MRQRLRHAVDERFGADEAVVGQHVGALGHVLAAAEADFEMQRAIEAEQAFRRHRTIRGYRDLRQQFVDQFLLRRAQRLALAATIQPVEGGGVAFFKCAHGAAAYKPTPTPSRCRRRWSRSARCRQGPASAWG